MSRTRLAVALLGACLVVSGPAALGDEPDAVDSPSTGRYPLPAVSPTGRRPLGPAAATGGAWWLGTAGVALALAALGGLSLASRRLRARGPSGALEVVGRASLSPRQAVYLLRVGDRVLIVGAGAQGPPSLLGELDDPDELRRPSARPSPPSRLDLRIGDEP